MFPIVSAGCGGGSGASFGGSRGSVERRVAAEVRSATPAPFQLPAHAQGWDKTYCLQYLTKDGYDDIHFFGCAPAAERV